MEKNILPQLEFYNQLSESYDQMISWPTRIGAEGMFFKKLVTDLKLKSSLDVACSTGFHVIMFRRLGLDAVGVDASPKMIERARANAITCGVTVEYILGDFSNLSKRFSEGFDIVTCLGDTISHLKTKLGAKRAFQESYKCLNPGGLFLLQNRNYNYDDYDKNGPDLIVVGEKRGVLKSKQAGKHSGASEKLERKPRSILGKVKQSTSEGISKAASVRPRGRPPKTTVIPGKRPR